mgnify:CR=1 FL=1
MKTLLPEINSADKRFHAGNPATGEQGTRVTDTWLNDVQDRVRDVQAEAHYVLEKAGFTPKQEQKTQLYQAIVKIIDDNRKKASTTQKGEVQLTSDTGLDSEELGLTAKAGKKLAQMIAVVQLALNNYIPLNKRSSAVNSNDENNVATSKAVKTAYDKGMEAKTAADNANSNANGRVSKSGDTMTGNLTVPNIIVNDPTNNNNSVQIGDDTKLIDVDMGHTVGLQATDNANDAYIAYGATKKRFGFDGSRFSADSSISTAQYGHGSYATQYTSNAPYMVEESGSATRDTYHPFIKGRVRKHGQYGTAFSFGYTTRQGAGDGFGRGIIHLIEDNGANRLWAFEHNGDLNSAGDVRSSSGKSLNNSVQTSDYRSQWGQTGWVKLPNGLILQWGKTPVIHDENSTDIVFPIAFPNKVLNIQLTENQMRTVHNHATHLAALNVTNSKFTFKINSTLPIDSSADWFAIGY